MRRFCLLLVLLVPLRGAVVLDRVAVIVGKQIIKASDIERDLRVTEFLNREPVDLSAQAKRKSAERLIEQAILRQEIATGNYRRPADSEADALLEQLRRDRFSGSQQRLRQALAQYGLTVDQLRAQLLWQLTVLRYIDERFRAGVLVTDDEVRAYYNSHLAELRKENPQDSSFETLQSKIRSSLEGERINQEYSRWFDEAHKRLRIEYKQDAFA